MILDKPFATNLAEAQKVIDAVYESSTTRREVRIS